MADNDYCPYSLRPISALRDSNDEHIVPHALGGPNSYVLRADKTLNSLYGSTVDIGLIGDPFVQMLATQHNIRTRTGQTTWTLRGNLDGTGEAVTATISSEEFDVRFYAPVVKNDEGKVVGVRGWGGQADTELERVAKSLARKGLTVSPGPRQTIKSPKISGQINIDLFKIARGLAKILYLATVEAVGNAYLRSPGAEKLRAAIDAKNAEEFEGIALPFTLGRSLVPLPDTPSNYHTIVVVPVEDKLISAVKLFNASPLTASFVSPDLGFGLSIQDASAVLIDATNRNIIQDSYLSVLSEGVQAKPPAD